MKTLALVALLFASSAFAQTPDGAFCTGEQIDTVAVGFPTPYIARDQTGILAIDVENRPDASLGLSTCFATNITVQVQMPDATGTPDPMQSVIVAFGLSLAPNETKTIFVPVNVANIADTTDFVNFNVVVDGLAQGRFTFSSERSVYLHVAPYVEAPSATNAIRLRRLRKTPAR